jgi:uncharacterized protein YjbJ (UPF0337 family)
MSATDKANNKGQEAKGAVQEAAGKLTGDSELRSKGKGNRIASDLKQAGEKLKDAIKK